MWHDKVAAIYLLWMGEMGKVVNVDVGGRESRTSWRFYSGIFH